MANFKKELGSVEGTRISAYTYNSKNSCLRDIDLSIVKTEPVEPVFVNVCDSRSDTNTAKLSNASGTVLISGMSGASDVRTEPVHTTTTSSAQNICSSGTMSGTTRNVNSCDSISAKFGIGHLTDPDCVSAICDTTTKICKSESDPHDGELATVKRVNADEKLTCNEVFPSVINREPFIVGLYRNVALTPECNNSILGVGVLETGERDNHDLTTDNEMDIACRIPSNSDMPGVCEEHMNVTLDSGCILADNSRKQDNRIKKVKPNQPEFHHAVHTKEEQPLGMEIEVPDEADILGDVKHSFFQRKSENSSNQIQSHTSLTDTCGTSNNGNRHQKRKCSDTFDSKLQDNNGTPDNMSGSGFPQTCHIEMISTQLGKPYKCIIFDSRFNQTCQSGGDHFGEKLHKCSMCDYQCYQKSDLKRHVRTHTGEKPFKCTMCDFKCSRKYGLDRHTTTHTGEKPYKCTICDYRAGNKYDLMIHARIHSGEKPYKCTMCDYRSHQRGDLTRHVRTHTGEKPYKCSVCDYRSGHKSCLNKHVRTHKTI